MISVEEALNIILKEVNPSEFEEKDILDCLNYVIYEDIYSKDNLPPFNKSAMDGYAIKSEDTDVIKNNGICGFKIVGLIKAGDGSLEKISNGMAIKIMTGAKLPEGADSVIQIEKVKVDRNKLIVNEEVKKGLNVIPCGDEIKAGEIALKRGTLIRPTEIGVLASLGYKKIKVYKIPVISLLITGDELVDIDKELTAGKVRNINEYSLKAMINNIGAKYLSFGVIEDKKETLKNKIKEALDKSDIVITSGGASVGDFDFVDEVLGELNAEVKFKKVSIKPGKPISFSVIGKKLFFSLPGNPLAAITTFEEFVKPACEKFMGKIPAEGELFEVTLAENFKAHKDRRKYLYVKIQYSNGKYYAYNVGSQSSNQLLTMSKANGIIIMPEGIDYKKAGEILYGKFIFK